MRLVLANRQLRGAGGTEVHLVTLGEHLQRLGHEPVLYATELGPFADHARRRGLQVHDSVRELPETCDVVFAQDGVVAHELAERYPAALSVFRICSDVHDFELPPRLAGVVDLVVVLSDRYERVARACAVAVPVVRLRMPIDIDRLVSLGALRSRPERVVMLGNYGERESVVRDAWGRHGLDVSRVGGDAQTYDVSAALADADVVVAKGRAALDAMACGRAVYVYDVFGGDGWVTPERYGALEADNFAGLATERVIDAAGLEADLADYRPQMGVVNRDLVVQHHSARDHVVALLSAIGEHAPGERTPAPLQELARLIALQWSWELTAREFRALHWPLREHAARAEQRAAAAAEVAREASDTARRATEEVARMAEEAKRAIDDATAAREHAVHSEARASEGARQLEAERDEALAQLAEERRATAQLLAEERRATAEQLAAERQANAELRARIGEIQGTRAWRLAARYWRATRRLRRARS